MHALIARSGFLFLCVVAAWLPLRETSSENIGGAFPGWPSVYEGQPIREIPLSESERAFSRNFPGRIAKFTDGRRDLILRWVTRPTRQLHSSEDCLRGLGYQTSPGPAVRDAAGARWSCFVARRGSHRVTVRERITSEAGAEWLDVSSWFWSASLGKSKGPWLAVTVLESGG